MKRLLMLSLVLVLGLARAADDPMPDEVRREAKAALDKGLAWLASQQKDGGYWSVERFPAMTGLPLWAFAGAKDPKYAAQMDKAVAFLLAKTQPDGGIYVPDPRRGGAGLGNYNTAVCMMGLHATGRKDVIRAIQKAREYVASTQLTGDDEHAGGFGYDQGGRRYTDLNNSGMAMDAMRRTQDVEDSRPAGEKKADLNWENALKYVENMQQKDGEDKGGFVYTKTPRGGGPGGMGGGRPPAGGKPVEERPVLKSYGSISYVGLLSLLHCQLKRNDPRVVSALDYCGKYWTLDENPGQGEQGLYFYYDILSRALNAAAIDEISQKSGGKVAWRNELAKKIVSLQKPEGYWVNDNNRWWENDPILTTSYSLIALEVALGMGK
ncbi:MAG: hypothetical protein IJU44_00705 [Kiritimatiellae bacterium]|nr:hypothetical protein [Kiritimatiellia bacterium]